MKKSILVSAVLSLSFIGTLSLTSTNVNAASYHNGVPKVFKNTKWRAKSMKAYGETTHARIHFYTKSLDAHPAFEMDPQRTYKIKYKYLGKGTYYLVGRVYNNAPAGGISWKYKVKRYSSHKIYWWDLTAGNHKYTNFTFTRY